MMGLVTSIVFFILAISLLVGIHEWGHYIVAKCLGVKVLRFSIGFGPKLISKTLGETEFSVAAIPLGGYVRMLDEKVDKVIPLEEKPRAFNNQSLSTKTAIVVAGPLMNFVFAVLAYFCMLSLGFVSPKAIVGTVVESSQVHTAGLKEGHQIVLVNGKDALTWEDVMRRTLDAAMADKEVIWSVALADGSSKDINLEVSPEIIDKIAGADFLTVLGLSPYRQELLPFIDKVFDGGAAAEAGMRSGDLLLEIDGQRLTSWRQWVEVVQANGATALEIDVLRDGRHVSFILTPDAVERNGVSVGKIGASVLVPDGFERTPTVLVKPSFVDSVSGALGRTWEMSLLTLKFIKKMVLGEVSTRNLSGPISIAKYAGQSADLGISRYLEFLALISVSLGVLNLLPIPLLDGGHLLYYLIEFVCRRPVPDAIEVIGHRAGFVILIGLMGTALYNDLIGLF